MAGALVGISYDETALAFLESIPKKHRRQIVSHINALVDNPHPPTSKALQNMMDGEDRVYRIRSGTYRVIYAVRRNPQHIIILEIGNRKDVYR
jgi:mRNA interferase RelE/StbE